MKEEEVYRHRAKQHIACGELLRDIIRLGVGRGIFHLQMEDHSKPIRVGVLVG